MLWGLGIVPSFEKGSHSPKSKLCQTFTPLHVLRLCLRSPPLKKAFLLFWQSRFPTIRLLPRSQHCLILEAEAKRPKPYILPKKLTESDMLVPESCLLLQQAEQLAKNVQPERHSPQDSISCLDALLTARHCRGHSRPLCVWRHQFEAATARRCRGCGSECNCMHDEESLSECLFLARCCLWRDHHRSDAVLVRGLASAGMLCSSESPFDPELLPLPHNSRL